MDFNALIFTLSCLGISETVYLIKKRLLLQKPICPIGDDCLVVLESKYSRIFFAPNDLLGLTFYIICSIISSLLVIEVSPIYLWSMIIKVLIVLGSLVSVYLTYIQLKIIKAWCFWCLMSAYINWVMLVLVIFGKI